MRRQPRFRSLPSLPFSSLRLVPLSLLSIALFATLASARTVSYNARNHLLSYAPQSAWSEVSEDGLEAMEASRGGSRIELSFAGEQISLFGSADSNFTVAIDGSNDLTSSSTVIANNVSADAASTRIFLASGLDRNTVHSLVLEFLGSGTFLLERVAVAYSTETGLVPALLPVGASGAVSTATLSATATSTSSSFPVATAATLSSAPIAFASSSALSVPTSNGPSRGGLIAGATIGSVGGAALLLFIFIIIRRIRTARELDEWHQQQQGQQPHDRSSYVDAETGRRRSSFLPAALRRNPSSPLPFAAQRNASSLGVDGGVGRTPGGGHTPTPVIVGSETWQSRLDRNASWKRKKERLQETRKFYNVGQRVAANGGAPPLVGPPPRMPLPEPPKNGSGTREMEERWRTEGPSLDIPETSRAGSRAANRSGAGAEVTSPSFSAYFMSSQVGSSPNSPSLAPSGPTTTQAFGQAISDYHDSPTSPTTATAIRGPHDAGLSSPHLRRRSYHDASCDTDKALPSLPPSPSSAAVHHRRSLSQPFSNPFDSAFSVRGGHSANDSYSSHDSHVSAENARISLAHPVATGTLPPIAGSPPYASPSSSAQHDHDPHDTDDVPLYSPSTAPRPLRTSSMRELVGTYRAGPNGDRSTSVVRPAAALARRPTLTRHDGETIQEAGGAGAGGGGAAAAARDSVAEELGDTRVDKHRSVAGLIETLSESIDGMLEESSTGPSRRSWDPPPGEEDRPAFFVKRERMPRYEAGRVDPRLPRKDPR
ncbi:hypothetical protein JCM5296_000768 [Sporobolomyces johnsonii]